MNWDTIWVIVGVACVAFSLGYAWRDIREQQKYLDLIGSHPYFDS